jgi:hypothetical protein
MGEEGEGGGTWLTDWGCVRGGLESRVDEEFK